jgi:hypothetical protein
LSSASPVLATSLASWRLRRWRQSVDLVGGGCWQTTATRRAAAAGYMEDLGAGEALGWRIGVPAKRRTLKGGSPEWMTTGYNAR